MSTFFNPLPAILSIPGVVGIYAAVQMADVAGRWDAWATGMAYLAVASMVPAAIALFSRPAE